MYVRRFYRGWSERTDLVQFRVEIRQSDLLICCDKPSCDAEPIAVRTLTNARAQIEGHIVRNPTFAASLEPVPLLGSAPPVIRAMTIAAQSWGVGPMAAVAGAIAEVVGRRLLDEGAQTVIVENGGDVFARADAELRFGLYAGEASPFSDRIAFRVGAKDGIGVCTSSEMIGPSLSFGRADAAVAIAADAALADAAATAIANEVKSEADVERAIAAHSERKDLAGVIICCGERLGVWGDLEIVD